MGKNRKGGLARKGGHSPKRCDQLILGGRRLAVSLFLPGTVKGKKHHSMSAIVQHAAAGDWTSVLKVSVTTGIVVAQSAAWDRAIGRVLAYVLQSTEPEPSIAVSLSQALLTTALGVATIYTLHRCMS